MARVTASTLEIARNPLVSACASVRGAGVLFGGGVSGGAAVEAGGAGGGVGAGVV
jgi:hypothetical protein